VSSRAASDAKVPGLGQVWTRALRASLASRMAYRADLFLSILVTLLTEMVAPLVTLLIYGSTSGKGFPGWGMYEVLLIQAVFLCSRGTAFPIFMGLMYGVLNQVRSGSFELTLLRPRSPLLILVCQGLDPIGLSRLAGGIALFVFAFAHLPAPNALGVLAFVLLFALALLVLFSLALFMSGTLFVWVGNGRVYELLDVILNFAQYPMSIFPKAFELIASVAMPIAMVAFIPAQALLGRSDVLGLAAIPASLVFFALSLFFWERMRVKYSGGGG
jgi:ABC-2 type transport system permease protein